jgi:transposase
VGHERHERHERNLLTDAAWAQLAPLLPPQKPRTGRPARAHRAVVEGILWLLRTGAPWRDLPERFGPWHRVASRFHRWVAAGVWARVLAALQRRADAAGVGVRIGLFLGATPVSGDLVAQVAQGGRAEADGFDGCWLTHIGRADAPTGLALAGPPTRRIDLGTAVAPAYPRHLTALAQQALSVNAATRGRLSLGIGPAPRPAVERLGLRDAGVARSVREDLSVRRRSAAPLVHEGRAAFAGTALIAPSATLRAPEVRPSAAGAPVRVARPPRVGELVVRRRAPSGPDAGLTAGSRRGC